MNTTGSSDDYIRFSQLAFLIVRDPIGAQVLAVDGVLAALRPTLAPDAPPGINRARRKIARGAIGLLRKRRFLPWSRRHAHAVELGATTQKVWACLEKLPVRQQVAVVLARFEGASLAEIADALDCSAAAANSYLDRAGESLRRTLGSGDLRPVLTRELRTIGQAFVATHSPDPSAADRVVQRARRWRAAGIALGVLVAAGAALLFSLLRG